MIFRLYKYLSFMEAICHEKTTDSIFNTGFSFDACRLRNIRPGIVLVQMSLPSQIFIIPQYQMVAKMGLANTIFRVIISRSELTTRGHIRSP